jgi:hypothetical protein
MAIPHHGGGFVFLTLARELLLLHIGGTGRRLRPNRSFGAGFFLRTMGLKFVGNSNDVVRVGPNVHSLNV